MTLDEEITYLTGIWYQYVGMDHHKDRDCHFYIETVWSYGQEPFYRPVHNGYIMEDWVAPKCSTYEVAQQVLRNKLFNEIKSAIMDCKDLIKEYDKAGYDYDAQTARDQLQILEKALI